MTAPTPPPGPGPWSPPGAAPPPDPFAAPPPQPSGAPGAASHGSPGPYPAPYGSPSTYGEPPAGTAPYGTPQGRAPYGVPPSWGAPQLGPGAAPPHDPHGRPGLAGAALVTGIIPLTCLLGIVFGVVARRQAARRGQRGRVMATWGLVLGLLWTALFVVGAVAEALDDPSRDDAGVVVSGGRADLEEVRVGDCVASTGGFEEEEEDVVDLPLVPCGTPHDSEVVAVFALPAGRYPGSSRVIALAEEGCATRFEDYVGSSVDETELGGSYVYPDRSTWDVDRTVLCLAEGPGLVGSVKGSGR